MTEIDLRRSPRVPFVASAQVTEIETDGTLRGRTGDLSRNGCYIDIISPLPQGTSVRVTIQHAQTTFTATAGVIFSQTPLGMGLEFREIDPTAQRSLEQWLDDALAASSI